MSYKKSLIVIDDFYDNPLEIRKKSIKDGFEDGVGGVSPKYWKTSKNKYLNFENKSKLEKILRIKIDEKHWEDETAWNGKMQIKLKQPTTDNQYPSFGFHDHNIDYGYNGVGKDGWTGVLFLGPNIKEIYGLYTCILNDKNNIRYIDNSIFIDPNNYTKDMYIASVFNRLVLLSSDIFHAGSYGYGDSIENGRMIQTFFFKEKE